MDRKFVLLRRHGCMDGLTDEEVSKIADDCEMIEVETNGVLHQAGDVLDSLYLIVQGRLKQSVQDPRGNEVLQNFLVRGTQFGGLAAAQLEPVHISVVAVEPSTVIKLDYKTFLDHTVANPKLLVNFIKLIGTMLKQTLRIDRVHRQPNVVMIIHGTSDSRELTTRVIDRLKELGEKPYVMTDDPKWKSRTDVTHLLMVEDGRWIEDEDARRQIVKWSAKERVFMELASNVDQERLIRGFQLADLVLVCIQPENWEATAKRLRELIATEPKWREKIGLVWMMDAGKIHSPAAPQLRELVDHDFKVSFSDPPENYGNILKYGVERIVHVLRGVRVGIALGGGAARGMAHLGVLKTLEQNGMVVDMIAGTSAGAMTGTVYASGMDMDYAVQSFVTDLTPSWFFRKIPGGGYWYLLYKYRRNQFDPMLRKYFSDLKLEQLPIPMNNVTVDLVSGQPKVRDRGDAVHGIVESFNLPGLSPPICRNGEALVDGGLVNNVPADVLANKGCNFVIAVSVTAKLEQEFGKIRPDTPGPKYKTPSSLQTIMRGYLVQNVNMNSVGVQPADIIIEPDVTKFDLSEFTRTDELAAVGAETTAASMENIRNSLAEIDKKLFLVN